jgi:hypothetical protein
MTTTGTEVRAGERTAALVTAGTGLAANAALVLFFALARPYDVHTPYSWLGPTNDALLVAHLAAFAPVAIAVRRRLPAGPALGAGTAAGVAAMGAAALLQVLLLAGAIEFDLQVGLVVAAFVVVFLWVLQVSLAGHRTGALPRPVTRLGVLVGAGFPLGLLLAGAGFLLPGPARWVPVGAGVVIGAAAWLALPVFPLLLATHVFSKERP